MCYRVGPRASSDLRDESFALLANVLSGGQATGVVERRVGARDGRLHVAQAAHRRARPGRRTHHLLDYYANLLY